MLRRTAALLFLAAGCAHSDDEWKVQVKDTQQLRAKLVAEQVKNEKQRASCADATDELERLRKDLREAGLSPTEIKDSLDERARAAEERQRRRDQIAAAKRRLDLLREKLASVAGVALVVRDNRVVLQVAGDLLFDPGKEGVRAEGRAALAKIAEVIRSEPSLAARRYAVAGHVEAGAPLGRFRTALALSAARAEEALAVLLEKKDRASVGLAVERFGVAAYGDADPLGPSDTPEGKQKNRRLEIVVLPSTDELLDLSPRPRSPAEPHAPTSP
jgi:chemotaxis protein MotB